MEKPLALNDQATDFARLTELTNVGHANRHAEQAHRQCAQCLVWWDLTFDRADCPIRGL